MKKIKKTLRFISIGLLVILLIAVIWYNWPQKQEDRFQFLPADSLLYGQLSVDWDQKGPAQLFDVFWRKTIAANPQLNNSLIKKLVLYLLPQDILFGVIYSGEDARLSKEPDYSIIIDLGKKTRLVSLAASIASYRGFKENKQFKIINNLVILKAANSNNEPVLADGLASLKALFKQSAREELNIYLPNKKKELSALVKLMESKNSFAFFPSIDLVDYVQVNGTLVSADMVKGKMSFASKNIADVDKIGLDAFFLNNLLMRLLLGYSLTYEGEASSLANFVEINYQVKELNKIWQQI